MLVSSGPDFIELAFEDWTDNDWNDIWLKFRTLPDGNLEITVTQKESGNDFDIKDPSGQPIPGLVGVTNGDAGKVVLIPGGAGGKYSYGMSAVAHRVDVDERKIIMLDYNELVADVVGPDGSDIWSVSSAPRHHGVCNALFCDGSVQGIAASKIDPTIVAQHDRLWCPRKVAPLSP
jgi:prepilin-type processing-associated H-X9-DG protein